MKVHGWHLQKNNVIFSSGPSKYMRNMSNILAQISKSESVIIK
jgi:hypothetical protein